MNEKNNKLTPNLGTGQHQVHMSLSGTDSALSHHRVFIVDYEPNDLNVVVLHKRKLKTKSVNVLRPCSSVSSFLPTVKKFSKTILEHAASLLQPIPK